MICGSQPEDLDWKDPRYFLDHSSLSWVQTTGREARNVPDVIRVPPHNYMVGRFNYIKPDGSIYQTIGRVLGSTMYFYQPGERRVETTTGAFEVLSCQKRDPELQCGTLLQFAVNNITELGFPSGTYIDGSTVYPGMLFNLQHVKFRTLMNKKKYKMLNFLLNRNW